MKGEEGEVFYARSFTFLSLLPGLPDSSVPTVGPDHDTISGCTDQADNAIAIPHASALSTRDAIDRS